MSGIITLKKDLKLKPFILSYLDALRRNKDGRTKLCYWIICCSYTVVEPPDGAWGVDLGNGTYNGMIGLVQKGVSNAMIQCRYL